MIWRNVIRCNMIWCNVTRYSMILTASHLDHPSPGCGVLTSWVSTAAAFSQDRLAGEYRSSSQIFVSQLRPVPSMTEKRGKRTMRNEEKKKSRKEAKKKSSKKMKKRSGKHAEEWARIDTVGSGDITGEGLSTSGLLVAPTITTLALRSVPAPSSCTRNSVLILLEASFSSDDLWHRRESTSSMNTTEGCR